MFKKEKQMKILFKILINYIFLIYKYFIIKIDFYRYIN